MITHFIIKHWKRPEKKENKLTKHEINEILNKNNYEVGDYITWVKSGQEARMLGQIDILADIQTDADKVEYKIGTEAPLLYNLMLIPRPDAPVTDPWTRWDTGIETRKITKVEYDQLVAPIHDYVQNYLKHWKETKSRNPPRKTH